MPYLLVWLLFVGIAGVCYMVFRVLFRVMLTAGDLAVVTTALEGGLVVSVGVVALVLVALRWRTNRARRAALK